MPTVKLPDKRPLLSSFFSMLYQDFRLPLTYPTIHNVIVTNYGTFPPISTHSKQPMVGRVISKTSMQNFSRPTDYRHEYPWKFSFEIQDCSHKLTVTVWNEKALEIFNSVKVGCLIWLNDYCVKRIMTKDRRIAGKGVEVTINPRDPEGDVRILGGKLENERGRVWEE